MELIGRGAITLPGLHNGSSLVLVFPEKECDNARSLLDALGGTSELRVISDQLPEGDSVAVAIGGFAEMEELSKCERLARFDQFEQEMAQIGQDLAQLEQENPQDTQRACASTLDIVTWLTVLTSNYDVERRSEIEKLAGLLEDTCGQPRVAGAIRAAMLDQDYDRAGTLAAATCDIGQTSGCHFGAPELRLWQQSACRTG